MLQHLRPVFILWTVTVATACLVLVSFLPLLVLSQRSSSQTSTSMISPSEREAIYRGELDEIKVELGPLLERPLSSADKRSLSGMRNRLLEITVPTSQRGFHFQLVLKLSSLMDLAASAEAPSQSVATAQAGLKQLVAEWSSAL